MSEVPLYRVLLRYRLGAYTAAVMVVIKVSPPLCSVAEDLDTDATSELQGYLAHTNPPPPQDRRRTIGIVLL